jgi:bifunctional DNA-binding transcriptional regulator/antitoxin component of YhaV-PrlF toxin-antitoxin module
MKSTGIVRKVDQLGRIVIPSELRKGGYRLSATCDIIL